MELDLDPTQIDKSKGKKIGRIFEKKKYVILDASTATRSGSSQKAQIRIQIRNTALYRQESRSKCSIFFSCKKIIIFVLSQFFYVHCAA